MIQRVTHCPDPENWVGRLLSKVAVTPFGCWDWAGGKNRDGYGLFHITAARGTGAHRAAWLAFMGDIDDGLTVDHLCRNRACINPKHMELVTLKENVRRRNHSRHSKRTGTNGCGRHGKSDGYPGLREDGSEYRWFCRTCGREKATRYRALKKAAQAA